MAVAKHDAYGINVDRPGKDSDRFYRAGADVLLSTSDEEVSRIHRDRDTTVPQLLELAGRYDVVLVEGQKHAPLPKLWLLGERETAPPPEVTNVLAVLPRDADRAAPAGRLLDRLIQQRCQTAPVFGGALIGGKSSRMGRPKHLLVTAGQTWLRRILDVLGPLCAKVVVLGDGELPGDLHTVMRVPDAPGVEGPMCGALAAMRWAPQASWLLVACDLPRVTDQAVRWLLATRAPGRWATLPKLHGSDGCEPLLAHYDFRCRILLERLACDGIFGLSQLAGHPKAAIIPVPAGLAGAWKNCNRPADVPP